MIHLTKAEQTEFRTLPAVITAGWEVVDEQIEFLDTPERRYARLDLMKLDAGSPLQETFDALRADTDENSIVAIAECIDPQSISEHDLREVLFVLGPSSVSVLISKALMLVKTPEDMDGVAALSDIRHELIASSKAR